MHKGLTAARIVFPVLLLLSAAVESRAIGVVEDAARGAGFLSSRWIPTVQGRILVTDGPGTEASMFLFAAGFVVKPWFLVEVELPYVTAAVDDKEIESGFGDLVVRGKFRLRSGSHDALALYWDIGTGTGEQQVFPFASQALEFALGVAWTDTVHVLEYWVAVGGETVHRAPDDLVAEEIAVDLGRGAAGLAVPIGPLGLRTGISLLWFEAGRTRDHYFAEVTWDHQDLMRAFVAAQREGGAEENRITDATASVGIIVYF